MEGRQILEQVQRLIKEDQYSEYLEINKAYREIGNSGLFSWLRESNSSLTTFTASTVDYELNLVDKKVLERLWVKGIDTIDKGWQMMEEAPPGIFEAFVSENLKTDGTDDPGLPRYYRMRRGTFGAITVTPTPDQAYEVKYDYLALVEEISESTIARLPIAHHDMIAELAASYILERSDDKFDIAYSNKLRGRYEKALNSMRTDSHPGRTGSVEKVPRHWIT